MKLITDVSTEPVALSLLKEHLRLDADDTSEDTTLNMYLATARYYAQTYTGKLYGSQTWKIFLRQFYNEITFPLNPVTSISSVSYLDSVNEDINVNNSNYTFDSDKQLLTFDDDYTFTTEKLSITLVAGETNIVPPVQSAILLIAGHLYENRESTTGYKLNNLPFGIENLLNTDKEYL